MKKIFILLFALITLSANAQTTAYEGVINVSTTMFGMTIPLSTLDGTLYVTKQDDGNYTININNFHLTMSGEELYVGNITVADIAAEVADDGLITLASEQNITIPAGDDPADAEWMGPDLGEVPVTVNGEISGDNIYLYLTIPVVMDVDVTFEGVAVEEDGIQAVSSTVKYSSGTPYTLQGTKAGNNYKGVVIQDGRKVLK